MSGGSRCLVVIRVRGVSDVRKDISDTLDFLCLSKPNHAVLIDDRPSYMGMLRKVQNQVAWGEISCDRLLDLLRKWGRLKGGGKLTDDYAKKLSFGSIEEMAKAILKGEVEYKSLPDIKPVFRLHPPRKGFKGKIKKSYAAGGVTGYQGEAINELLRRMV